MRPVEFEGQDLVLGAPPNWDQPTEGECMGLPVMRHDGQCISCWEPSEAEREAIANGAKIWLSVYSGQTQPPVMLIVGRPSK